MGRHVQVDILLEETERRVHGAGFSAAVAGVDADVFTGGGVGLGGGVGWAVAGGEKKGDDGDERYKERNEPAEFHCPLPIQLYELPAWVDTG